MSNLRRSARLAAVAVVGALILAACGGGDDDTGGGGTSANAPAFNLSTTTIIQPSTKTGGTLRLAAIADADSWDPARAYLGWAWNMQRLYVRKLMDMTPNPKDASKVIPDLATAPGEASADFKTFKYTLKDGVKFEDGTPIKTADIKYGLERAWATDVIVGGPTAYYLCLLDTCKDGTPTYKGPYKDAKGEPMVNGKPSIETPDDKTIIFHLAVANADLDYLMAMGPSGPVPQAKDDGENYGQHPVASGPFKITHYDKDTGTTFERNNNWDPATDQIRKPLVDKVEITYISNSDDIDQRLKAGTIDARTDSGLEPTFTNEVMANPTLKKNVDNPYIGLTWYLVEFPFTKPFDNIHCRTAVAYALNKKAIVTAVGGTTFGDVRGSMLYAGLPGSDVKRDPYPSGPDGTGDLDKAKSELAACGQPSGFATNLGYINTGTGPARATAIQEGLGRVGIKVTLKAGDPSSYYNEFIGNPNSVKKNKLGLAVSGWGADYPTLNGFFYPIVHGDARYPNGTSNYALLNDPKVNDGLNKALQSPRDQWDALGAQIDDAVLADAVYIPMYWGKDVYYRNPRLTNVYSTILFGFYDWVNMGTTDGQ
jgi:peptide/nickel transport system substrate-binding protein